MPNRIIRESLLDSERVNALSEREECWYHRLLLIVDDAGRYDGRPRIVASRAYPLRDNIRGSDVENLLRALQSAGLLIRYEWAGKPYIQLTRWSRCGRTQSSKWPWRDGSLGIEYTVQGERPNAKGELVPCEWVATSMPDPELSMPDPETSGPDTDPIPETRTPSDNVGPHPDPIRTPSENVGPHPATYTYTDTDTSTEKTPSGAGAPDGGRVRERSRFAEFWGVYPKKVSKKKCRARWTARKLDAKAETIIADVAARVQRDPQWQRGFVPNPETYLNGDRWEDDWQSAPRQSAGPMPIPPVTANRNHVEALEL